MSPTLSAASTKTASIATGFTRKLYRMLDVEDPAVIGWDAAGLSFSLRDEEQLDSNVLPRYFRGRVDVFRQHLSEHGFRSMTTVVNFKQIESFSHAHFVRGEPNRLSLIVCVPTNKRRRSRLGKKRSIPEVPLSADLKREDMADAMPSFMEDDNFNFSTFLHGPTASTLQAPREAQFDLTREDDALHSSLVNILALHATNPVIASKAMLDDEVGRPINVDQIDTPLFSLEMMTSMVEWLDMTA